MSSLTRLRNLAMVFITTVVLTGCDSWGVDFWADPENIDSGQSSSLAWTVATERFRGEQTLTGLVVDGEVQDLTGGSANESWSGGYGRSRRSTSYVEGEISRSPLAHTEYELLATYQDAEGGEEVVSVMAKVYVDELQISEVSLADSNLYDCLPKDFSYRKRHYDLDLYLHEVSYIDCADSGVTSVGGLEVFEELTSLNLDKNSITDVSSLVAGPVKTLGLSETGFTNTGQLGQLTALTNVDLSGNGLTSIAGLNNLQELTTLAINDNNLTDLTPLLLLPKLRTVYVFGNPNITCNTLNILLAKMQLNFPVPRVIGDQCSADGSIEVVGNTVEEFKQKIEFFIDLWAGEDASWLSLLLSFI